MTKRCPRCRKTFDHAGQFCPDDGAPLSAGNPLDSAVAAALAADYRILEWLGSGGMGTVFLAEQIRVGNRKVALKVLHRKFSEDDEFITRFENEAASTGRINHPNVITIYESKQAPDGTLYIAMELVEGESLTEHLRKRGRLPLEETAEIVGQCCKALQAAHRLGIIHRDIKPDNIMLTRDLDGDLLVKILDFGIAKLKDSSGHTVTGSVLGTPAYMSYEQASGLSSEMLDGRSDIYSLGVVTYTMLAGHPPFRADTPVGYITKHLSEAPVPLRTARPGLPASVEVAVMRALEKDREKRFQAATDFGAALREAARAPGAPRLDTTPTPAPPWRARPAAAQTTPAGPENPPTPGNPAGEVTVRPEAMVPPADSPVSPVVPAPPVAARPALPPVPTMPPPPAPVVEPAPPERRPRQTPPPVPAAARTAPPRRAAPLADETPARRTQPAGAGESGEGVAVALWGVRTLLSWALTAYAVVFLALAAWPLVAPYVGGAVIFPLVVIGQPVVQQVAQWLPSLRFGDWDPLPLALGVLLLVVRPRITTPLWRLEARYRARAATQEVTG